MAKATKKAAKKTAKKRSASKRDLVKVPTGTFFAKRDQVHGA